jgi:hypothetical protein
MVRPITLTEALRMTKAAVDALGGSSTGRSPDAGSAKMEMEEPLFVKFCTVTCSA